MNRLKYILLCTVLLATLGRAADQASRAIVKKEDPEYPQLAKNMNLHGSVKLKIWIKPDGSVRRLEYVGGHPLLVESALKAVKNWRYASSDKESTSMVELKF